ncbi:hypothetical protein ES703_70434 [subsurface metagenome]
MYFIKAQESNNKWWQYVIGIIIVSFAYLIIGSIPLGIVLYIKMTGDNGIDLQHFLDTYDTEALGIDQNTGLVLLLFPAVISFFVLLLLMINLHGKKLGAVASAAGKIRWKRLFTGAFVWLLLLVLAEGLFYSIDPGNYEYNLNLSGFLPLVVISFLIIPIQAWFEELFFRSYLLAGIGLLFRLRFLALLITSAAFGLLHFSNPEVREFGFWVTMPYYVAFGLFAGLLVIYDNGIELACGVHAINNIFGAVLVTYESSVIKTSALWKIKTIDPVLTNLGFLVLAILFMIIMARLYRWGDWRKLFATIPVQKN